jgi:hypothetical protein
MMFHQCTDNPVDNSVITAKTKQVHGKVTLQNERNHEGIYVWLEGYDIGTYTDQSGEFTLSIPSEGSQFMAGSTNAMLYLYFYMANYQISSAILFVVDGEFLMSRGDIGAHGELNGERTLSKMMRIETVVAPDRILVENEYIVNVQVFLQALYDSVEVTLPKIIGSSGIALLKNQNTGDVYVYLPESYENEYIEGRLSPEVYVWNFVFYVKEGDLPQGRYEVIPYLYIEQEGLPVELLESLDPNFGEVGAGYLNIPFRREGGQLNVVGES